MRFVISSMLSLFVIVAPASLATAAAQADSATPKSVPNSVSGDSGKSLSTKLGESGGVITPKQDVDPGIAAPAPVPHPNSTPVIPPSATGRGTAK